MYLDAADGDRDASRWLPNMRRPRRERLMGISWIEFRLLYRYLKKAKPMRRAITTATPPATPAIRPGVKGEAGDVRCNCSPRGPLGGAVLDGDADADTDSVDTAAVGVAVGTIVASAVGSAVVEGDTCEAGGCEDEIITEVEVVVVEVDGEIEMIVVGASATVAALGGGSGATGAGLFPVFPELSGIAWRLPT